MKQKHTPGPWHVCNSDSGWPTVRTKFKGQVCMFGQMIEQTRSEVHDNARLIAAAPDLLAALQRLTPILEIAESDASGNPEWADVSERINAARAAIAKATGEAA